MNRAANGRNAAHQRGIQSIDVGARLLAALADASGALPLKELAARTGLSPARAHAYLVSYARSGLVEQDGVSGRYDLGPLALRLGLASLNRLDPVRIAGARLPELARTSGHSAAMAVWGNHGPTIVRFEQAARPIHVNMRTGTVMSMMETATGVALTAYRSSDAISSVISTLWSTPEERKAAQARIAAAAPLFAQARQRRLARAAGHPVPGVHAFSAPVFDHAGEAVLAVTLLGPAAEFDVRWSSPLARLLGDFAAEVSRRLGHQATTAGST